MQQSETELYIKMCSAAHYVELICLAFLNLQGIDDVVTLGALPATASLWLDRQTLWSFERLGSATCAWPATANLEALNTTVSCLIVAVTSRFHALCQPSKPSQR